ncbi:MAG: polysaccharide export protein EpsE [Gammaproteobacteria bacterium]|nr:polysaccharide export protein EpsE [Gammaproteobacteria bacterium]MBU1481726.1 polysaccharide export protein EpsE [Gammaproteobacteria bacterium]
MFCKGITRLLLLLSLAVYGVIGQAAEDNDYRLGAGDTMRIVVFQNPDLTTEVRVSESGVISYPLLGSVELGGLTVAGAEKKIAGLLKEGKFVQQPQVNIVLTQIRGNQVSVLGQVNRPGRYPLETFNTHVSDVLALAGGANGIGSDSVILTGVRNNKPFRKEIDIPGLFLDDKRKDDVLVEGGDLIYVQRAPMYYIYGEVQRPGSYRVERNMTLMQALAQSGGPTLRGTQKNMKIFRRGASGKLEEKSLDLTAPVNSEDVLYVRESLF